jgi:hypothetical protein
MKPTIEEIQDELTERYLGKLGIHSVALRQKRGEILISVESNSPATHEDLQSKIIEQAKPYPIIFVVEEPAEALAFA